MKSFKNTLALALTFTVAVGFANDYGKNGKAVNEVEKKVIKLKEDPTFIKKGGRLFINLLNLDQEKVVIRVKDSEGRTVYSEVIKGEMIIEKAFNFEKAYKDDYTVEIIDNKKSFKEVVEVK